MKNSQGHDIRARSQNILVGGVVAGFILGGCATQIVSNDYSYDFKKISEPIAGIPYSLPALQYGVTANYTLIECDAAKGPKFRVDLAAVPQVVEGARFVIDPQKLATKTKTATLEVKYHEGTQHLESINASVDDRGPEIASNVLSAGFAIARLAFPVPAAPALPLDGPPPGGATPPSPPCDPQITQSVKILADALKRLEAIPIESNALSLELDTLTLKAQLGALTPTETERANQLVTEVQKLADDLKIINESIANLQSQLTYNTSFTFPEHPQTGPFEQTFDPTVDDWRQVDDWLQKILMEEWLQEIVDGNSNLSSIKKKMSLEAKLVKVGEVLSTSISGNKITRSGSDIAQGIYYRQPAPGRLTVKPINSTVASEAVSIDALIPQFGQIYALTLENGWGEDNEITAEFSETGALLEYTFESKSSQLESLSGTLNEAATGALSFANERRATNAAEEAADRAAITTAREDELAALQFEIDQLMRANQLAQLREGEDSAATERARLLTELQAEQAILMLQIQIAELRTARDNP